MVHLLWVGGCCVASWDQKPDCYVIRFVDLVQGGRDRDFEVEGPGEVMAVEILPPCVSVPLPLASNMRWIGLPRRFLFNFVGLSSRFDFPTT